MYVVSLSSEASLTSRTQSPDAHFVFSGPCPVILGLFAPRGVSLRLSLCIFYLEYMEFPGCTSCAVLGWTCVACCHPKRKLEPLIHIPALTELLCGWAEKREVALRPCGLPALRVCFGVISRLQDCAPRCGFCARTSVDPAVSVCG